MWLIYLISIYLNFGDKNKWDNKQTKKPFEIRNNTDNTLAHQKIYLRGHWTEFSERNTKLVKLS